MSRILVKYTTWLGLMLIFYITGCSSPRLDSFSQTNEGSKRVSQIFSAVSSIIPLCAFEEVKIKDGKVFNNQITFQQEIASWLPSTRLLESDLILAVDSDGKLEWSKPPIGTEYLNIRNDKFFVCNSLGRKINSLQKWEDIFGANYFDNSAFCWSPNQVMEKENLKRLNRCEETLEANSKLGFWVVVRESKDPSRLTETIKRVAKNNLKYGSDLPVMFNENYAITFAGEFDSVNYATISNIDLIWKELKTQTDFSSISSLVSGYRESFNRDSDYSFEGERGDRKNIALGYDRVVSWSACNKPLRITETSYAIGSCGTLKFSVIQSDLSTGSCNFLGYWDDVNGQKRIGIVSYCKVYDEGAFIENNTYTLSVRVNGISSYLTKLGYLNSVLSFTVVK